MTALVLTIPGIFAFSVESLEEASRVYGRTRQRLGLGSRDMAEGRVSECGVPVARISYNGRIWPPGEWVEGMKPLQEAAGYEEGH
jgi:hypothetical protein